MDALLSEEQRMIVDTVRRFVEEEIYPHEDLVERSEEVPEDLAQQIKQKTLDLGFYACNFPEEVGCAGLNHLEFALVERELGRGSMALTHFFGRPQKILMAAKGNQIERFLMPAVKGEKMDALAMTEPGAGSDVRAMKTHAVKKGKDWILNGNKHFISGAEHADFIIVFAATGEADAKGRHPLSTFLVERGTKGFTMREGYKNVSHRGYKNMILEFDNCVLSDDELLGEADSGLTLLNDWLFATRITVAAMAVGRARRAMDMAVDYAAMRKQFGQAIGRFQGVGFQLADMMTQIDAADGLTLNSARMHDLGQDASRLIAEAKLMATEMLAMVTDTAIQIHGGMGLMNDLPLERFWRDARVERIWDGTSEIQRHIIARELLRPKGI